MPKNITKSSIPLDEANAHPSASVKLFLRDQDDDGNSLSGTDRYYIAVTVEVDIGRDETGRKVETVVRQLASVPAGVISNADKLNLVRICKAAYNAARSVATND